MPAISDYSLGFQSQDQEIAIEELPVRGRIPAWLSGALIRNTPAKFEVGRQSYRHWFDGLAMLHRFAFHKGQVSYANRFLQTRAYRTAKAKRRISMSEFATDPCYSLFGRVLSWFSPRWTDNASVNIGVLAGRSVAMTETPLPIEFDPETLRTLGVFDAPGGVRGQFTTAHPHFTGDGTEAINYVTHLARKSRYNIYRIPGDGSRRSLIASVPVEKPAYMHSFGMTENFVILAEFPLVVSPLKLKFAARPFIENYRWEPARGVTFRIISRRDGVLRATVGAESFFAFHHVNAFEEGEEVVLDIAAYEDASIISAFYLARARRQEPIPQATLRRYRLPLDRSTADFAKVADEPIELPRINYGRCNGKPYRFAYGVSTSSRRRDDFYNQLIKVDVADGRAATWSEQGCYPGEPVFVASPNATEEDEGVILSVVLDVRSQHSMLLVLDARTLEEIGRAEVPQHIPFGFHGQYIA